MQQQVSLSLCVLVIIKNILSNALGLAILAYPALPGQVEVLANLLKTRQAENFLSCQTH